VSQNVGQVWTALQRVCEVHPDLHGSPGAEGGLKMLLQGGSGGGVQQLCCRPWPCAAVAQLLT
jgi:hypothetical protein